MRMQAIHSWVAYMGTERSRAVGHPADKYLDRESSHGPLVARDKPPRIGGRHHLAVHDSGSEGEKGREDVYKYERVVLVMS